MITSFLKIQHKPLRCALLFVLVGSSALVMFLSIIYSYVSEKRAAVKNIASGAEVVAERLSFTLAQPLWDFNAETVEKLEAQELKSPDVLAIMVRSSGTDPIGIGLRKNQSETGTLISFKGFENNEDLLDALDGLVHSSKLIVYEGKQIGVVQVIATTLHAERALHDHIISHAVQALIVLLSIVVLIYVGLSKYLIKPVHALTEVAEKYAMGDLTAKSDIGSGTELAILGATLNKMADQLKDRILDLEWQSSHDALTGIFSRGHLYKHIAQKLAEISSGECFSIVFVDITNLKFVNETFGHDFGDRVLIEVASLFKKICTNRCFYARFASNEFVIVTPPGNESIGAFVAESINKSLLSLIKVNNVDVLVRGSIGHVTAPYDGTDVDQLLKNGEAAVYEARRLGQQTVVPYCNELHNRFQRHMMLESLLYRSVEELDEGEFRVHYQPIFCATTGKVLAVEALLRWDVVGEGPILPEEFIPILEETSLIIPVSDWVLKRACRQCVVWRAGILPDVCLSVNISSLQFQRGDLVETVRSALEATGLEPEALCLELTESMLINCGSEFALKNLLSLKELGVRLSLDDFGTGYSSLAYLARLPVNEIKIDRSFVQHVFDSRNDAAVVNTIVAMAKELDLHVVAEGIETSEQYDHLAGCGCSGIQGFLLCKPLSPAELGLFVKNTLDASPNKRQL